MLNPNNLVFVDETGIDEYLQREYARAPIGKQVISEVYGRKYGRGLLRGFRVRKRCLHPMFLMATRTQKGLTDGLKNVCCQSFVRGR